MATLAERLLEHGIRPPRYADGDQKLVCPNCSHTRRKRNDPCLSLTIDGDRAVWLCHHCQWKGAVSEHDDYRPPLRRRKPPVKPTSILGNPTPELLQWFAGRGISAATVERNRISSVRNFIPALGAEVDCIAFPYFRGSELVNIKFRALAEKQFAQVKGAEKILYGLDDIADVKSAVIVEGELDKLALEEAGIRNVVSVPNGAPKQVIAGQPEPDDAKVSYIATCAEYLERLDRIILAVDNDGPGLALAEELARRLGKERCKVMPRRGGGQVGVGVRRQPEHQTEDSDRRGAREISPRHHETTALPCTAVRRDRRALLSSRCNTVTAGLLRRVRQLR